MDKKLFFVIGSILVVILLAAVWGYLLFFGGPGIPGTFTDLTISNETEITPLPLPNETEQTTDQTDESTPSRLRQLTTRPVAGFREIQISTSSPRYVYFVEAGTGHLYQIDPENRTEERLSGTTLAMASEAHINSRGDTVVVRSGQGDRAPVHIGTTSASAGSLTFSILPNEWLDYSFSDTDELLLAQKTDSSVVLSVRNLTTDTARTLLTIPFREATIQWGKAANGPHFIYPKPTRYLEGALFATRNGSLIRQPVDGYGLTALSSVDVWLYNRMENNEYRTFLSAATEERIVELPFTGLPEKCVFATNEFDQTSLYCATDFLKRTTEDLPDSWYQGVYQANDSLWGIDLFGGSSLLTNPEREIGRPLDISSMSINEAQDTLYFINKTDNTLWQYAL